MHALDLLGSVQDELLSFGLLAELVCEMGGEKG
jgi:hypothetical protein